MLLEARHFHLRIVPKNVLSTTSSPQPSWLFRPLVQQLYEMFLWHAVHPHSQMSPHEKVNQPLLSAPR
jgi:hypothetical protein